MGQELKVLPLKHISALHAEHLLNNLYRDKLGPKVRVVAGGAGKQLIVFATPVELEQIERFLKAVDIPSLAAQQPTIQVRVYPLKYLANDASLESILGVVLGQQGARGDFALDRAYKQLIVRADEPVQQTIEQVLRVLDRPAARPDQSVRSGPAFDVRVRVVWLVSGLNHGNAPAPPDDLKDVVAELARLGIEKPRLAAQTLVNTVTDATFETQGLAKLDRTYTLRVAGQVFVLADEGLRLKISLRAVEQQVGAAVFAKQVGPLCNIETVIVIPLGHSVVLGVTPSETMTSAFVVQVLPRGGGNPAGKP